MIVTMQQLSVTLIILGSFVLTGTDPSVVYLTKSNASMAVMYIQGVVFVMILCKLITKLFFGQLRATETEHLMGRTWHAAIETCLAFTVFRDEFLPRFVSSFVLLLLLKCFHWLGEDRVDYMERSPIITVLFHSRMLVLISVLSAVDSYYVSSAYFSTLLRGASVQLVFGLGYPTILMTVVFMMWFFLECDVVLSRRAIQRMNTQYFVEMDLPDNVLLQIFSFLDWRVRLKLESVSTKWQRILLGNVSLQTIGPIDLDYFVK